MNMQLAATLRHMPFCSHYEYVLRAKEEQSFTVRHDQTQYIVQELQSNSKKRLLDIDLFINLFLTYFYTRPQSR